MFTVYFNNEAVADFETISEAADWISHEVNEMVMEEISIPRITVV